MSRWLNFDAVTVPATAGGIDLLTAAQQNIMGLKAIVVTPAPGADVEMELYTADERSGLLAEVVGRPVEVRLR